MKKILINALFIFCIIGMLIGAAYSFIHIGQFYVNLFTEVGLLGLIIYFTIGAIYYALFFYVLYRVDLAVRKKLK